jgi:biliverdin reductase
MVAVRVGVVGTGYAAKVRIEALKADPRATVVAIAGRNLDKTSELCQIDHSVAIAHWPDLIARDDIDLVIISTINRDHGAIALAALQAHKHVVLEYPLALSLDVAETLVNLSVANNRLLHVEHIELLSSVHTAVAEVLPQIGALSYLRYASLSPQRPAPLKWTYHPELFGFPLVGALSRVSRLTDLFGSVDRVHCQARYWGDAGEGFYTACLCSAQLSFSSGLVGDLIYGKGDMFWQGDRSLTIQGQTGAIVVDGEAGQLIQADGATPLAITGRRGLFAKDTTLVLDHLTQGSALYTTPQASLYALRVADAARQSAETNTVVQVSK